MTAKRIMEGISGDTMPRGFILHPTWRPEGGRPVIRLFGRLEDGRSFLARVPAEAYFFVRASDAAAARAAGAARQEAVDLRTLADDPVVRVLAGAPEESLGLRDALARAGLPLYEADVRFVIRYLIDRGVRGAVEIEPSRDPGPVPGFSVDLVFDEPTLRPSDFAPAPGLLRRLSIDLETDPRGAEIYSAALAGEGGPRVFLALTEAEARARLGGATFPYPVIAAGDEAGLLRALFARLREIDFDILTGWNVIDFDLEVLLARSHALGVPFEVGRARGTTRVLRERAIWGRARAEIAGRLVLDGLDLMRASYMRLDDYRLDTAARAVLGEGKVALGPPQHDMTGRDRALAIQRAFRDELPRFVEYNQADARLVLDILDRAQLVELAITRSLLTGMPLDRVGASIASFDFLYLHELRRRGRVAPVVRAAPAVAATPMVGAAAAGDAAPADPAADVVLGGAVLEPRPGLYDNVLAFDFRSLYPSLIRTFNIDPAGHVPEPRPEETASLIRAPNGAYFRRDPGILPGMLETLFPQRAAARRRGDAVAAHAIKILMNSFYGVLAAPGCRFFSLPVANAITHFGQWVLRWARDRVEATGHPVLYGDTDSLFVAAGFGGRERAEEALALGAALRDRINAELADEIRRVWAVESRLVLELDTLYLKFFLPSMRGGTAGARKRYAGLTRGAGGAPDEVVFVGMEVVRRDWTDLSKMYQRGLFERLFQGRGPDEVLAYTRDFVRDLRDGRHDDRLVYRKALRKALDDYTATTPPHVKAARMTDEPVSGLVEYIVTRSGPQPASALTAPVDHEHYVEKQIRPIAEQVFAHLGLSLDEATGEPTQMRLF